MNSLNMASEGLLYSPTPLSIATHGLIWIEDVEDVVVVIEQPVVGGGGGGWSGLYMDRYKIEKRTEDRKIYEDDDEVVEILIQLLLSGVIR